MITIPMTAAALGTEVEVATLEADLPDATPETSMVTVTVPPAPSPAPAIAVDGKGVPRLRGVGRGQLGVTLAGADADPGRRRAARAAPAAGRAARRDPARGQRAEARPAACSVGCGTRSPASERPSLLDRLARPAAARGDGCGWTAPRVGTPRRYVGSGSASSWCSPTDSAAACAAAWSRSKPAP